MTQLLEFPRDIPTALLTPDYVQHIIALNARTIEQALPSAVPWRDDLPFQPLLTIQARSFQERIDQHRLFDLPPTPRETLGTPEPISTAQDSPCGNWRFNYIELPRGTSLRYVLGNRKGRAVFDGPVRIPQLWQKEHGRWGGWDRNPLMSLTPQEIVSLNRGNRFAKGHVLLGGLGLGWQLAQICRRPQVKRVTVAEIDQSLVDWLWPRIQPFCSGKDVQFQIGDVRKVGRDLQADSALVDTFDSYGNRAYERAQYLREWPGIKSVWCWGNSLSDS